MHALIPIADDYSNPQINRLMSEALRCPECGAGMPMLVPMSENCVTPRFLIACRECNHQGPKAKNLPDALKRWNKPLSFFTSIKMGWIKK